MQLHLNSLFKARSIPIVAARTRFTAFCRTPEISCTAHTAPRYKKTKAKTIQHTNNKTIKI